MTNNQDNNDNSHQESSEENDRSDLAPSAPPPPPPPPPSPNELAKLEMSATGTKLEIEPLGLDQIPFDLVSRHDKKTVQLLANSGNSKPMKGKRIWFIYEFEELVMLEDIAIHLADYSDYSTFDFSYTVYDGSRVDEKLTPQNDQINKPVNALVKSIAFRPPRGGYRTGYIRNVTLFGFALRNLSEFAHYARNLDLEKAKISSELANKHAVVLNDLIELKELQQKEESMKSSIESSKGERSDLAIEIAKLKSRRDETVARIEGLEQSVRENQQTVTDQKNKISEVSEIRSQLARSIIEKKERLSALTANINLFPSELSDFVAQGSKDVRIYSILAAIPIFVIAAMFAVLVKGGVDLTTTITIEQDINIFALFMSRMPFVIVAATVITACYYLARMFILEMVRVNRQKLSLTKIGIIAKDISYSTTNELELDEDEKYSRRLTLKMDMLRDHLKEYLSKDFEPTLPRRSPFEQMRIPGLNLLGREDDEDSEHSSEASERGRIAASDSDDVSDNVTDDEASEPQ